MPVDELMRNEPKTVEFSLPLSLKDGAKHFVSVRSLYSPSGRLRSKPVEGISSSSFAVSLQLWRN